MFICVVISVYFSFSATAFAGEHSCYIQASDRDVYVRVAKRSHCE